MSDNEFLKFAQEHPDKVDEKEKKDTLNAVRIATLAFIIVELLLTFFKIWKKQNVAENFGVTFLFVGLFDYVLYKKQEKKLRSYLGIGGIILGVFFLIGYVGMVLQGA